MPSVPKSVLDRVYVVLLLIPFMALVTTPIVSYVYVDRDPARSLSLMTLVMSVALLTARVTVQLNKCLSYLESGTILISECIGAVVAATAITATWLTIWHGSVLADLILSLGFLGLSAIVSSLVVCSNAQLHLYHLRSIIIEEVIGLTILVWALVTSFLAPIECREVYLTAFIGGSVVRCYSLFAIETIKNAPWR